MILFHT